MKVYRTLRISSSLLYTKLLGSIFFRDNMKNNYDLFRVFDKDKDGFLTVNELRKIMTTMGKKMKKNEVEEMVLEADIAKNGLINLQDFCSLLIYGPKTVMLQKSSKLGRKRIQDKCRDDYSSRSGSFSQG